MSIDDTTIRDLLGFEDAKGVLSVYTGFSPAQAADPQPTAPIEIRNQLKALRAEVAGRDPDLVKVLERRLAAAVPAMERLLDSRAPGRGRALFLGLEDGRSETVAIQLPFRERVVLHDGPYLRPLVAAHDEGRAAGVLVVSRAGARVLRWQVGEVEELEAQRFDVSDDVAAPEKAGPSPGNPEHPHHGFVDRDRFEERIATQRHRFLRGFAEHVRGLAKQHGWDRLVLSSPPKLREVVEDALHEDGTLRVLIADASWEDASAPAIADAVWPLLRSVHLDRERTLAAAVLDRRLSGGPAAVGLRHVCSALNEGRVAHLVFDDARTVSGYRAEDGTLHPRIEGLVAQSDLDFSAEPLFLERLVERAIATGARVTPLEPDAAAHLDEHEGVGALLRW